MVNIGPTDTVPERFKDRLFYQHNATVTLMRATVEGNARLGEDIGRKMAASTGPATIVLPLFNREFVTQGGQGLQARREVFFISSAKGIADWLWHHVDTCRSHDRWICLVGRSITEQVRANRRES